MDLTKMETSVGDLVAERPSRARVFEQFGIDYCCGGRKTVGQACRESGNDPEAILQALRDSDGAGPGERETDWRRRPLSELIDHVLSTHHVTLCKELPRLAEMMNKVVSVHGPNHPELSECRIAFQGLKDELEIHMAKEEEILFPRMLELESAQQPTPFHCGTIAAPIAVMEQEHVSAGRAFAKLRELTRGYTPPDDACNTYRALLDGLAELESDLFRHIHKENNILFPMALETEASTR